MTENSLGVAVLDLGADPTLLEKDIANTERDALTALNKMGTKLQSVGKGWSVAVTAPVIGLGLAAVNAASDTEESLGKASVVFGEHAGDIIQFAQDAAANLGIANQAALESLGTFGNLFVAMGIGVKESASLSTNILTLGSDLASFNNLDPTEVLEKLRAGLTGEAEGLKVLGVNLRAAEVDQLALEKAQARGSETITEADRVLARYDIIVRQTSLAQGDFARTADGLANSTRIAQAEIKNEAAALGQELLPFALQAITILRDLLARYRALDPGVKSNILKVLALAAAVGPLLIVLGTLISAISTIVGILPAVVGAFTAVAAVITGPIAAAIAIGIALIAGLALAWKTNFLGIQDTVSKAKEFIELIFKAFAAAFRGDWTAFGEFLRQAWDLWWNTIEERIRKAKDFLVSLVNNIVEAIRLAFQIDWAVVGDGIIEGIKRGIDRGLSAIKEAAQAIARAALDAAKAFLGISSPSVRFDTEVGQMMGAGAARGWTSSISLLEGRIKADLGKMIPGVSAAASNSWDQRQYTANATGSGASAYDIMRDLQRMVWLNG